MGVVNDGLKLAANKTFDDGTTITVPEKFSVGYGTTAFNVADSEIEKPAPITSTSTIDTCEAVTGWNANLTNSVSLNTTTYRVGSAAINIIKTDVSSTLVSAEKATTVIDFTSKKLYLYIYKDSSEYSDVLIDFGNDSSNYFTWTETLSAGWNVLELDQSEAIETGSVSLTTCDYVRLRVNTDLITDTIDAGELVFDSIFASPSSGYFKDFEASSPIINDTTKEVTINCKLTSSEANGFYITEFGIFNTDATPLMVNHNVFEGISKTSTDEIIFSTKFRFRSGDSS